MKRLILVALGVGIMGCASIQREPGIGRVRLVGITPQNCKFIGEISGSYRGDSVSGGIVPGDGSEYTEIDFRNHVVRAGGNTVELRKSRANYMLGEVYFCKEPEESRRPASSQDHSMGEIERQFLATDARSN
jgi:hypothetical protein